MNPIPKTQRNTTKTISSDKKPLAAKSDKIELRYKWGRSSKRIKTGGYCMPGLRNAPLRVKRSEISKIVFVSVARAITQSPGCLVPVIKIHDYHYFLITFSQFL